jgi:5-oxoprolinase (ATP-hydrolysing)
VNCTAYVTANGDLKIKIIQAEDADHSDHPSTVIKADPVKLSIFSHRFMGIAEQM